MNMNPDIGSSSILRRPGASRLSQNSPLVNYALGGLRRCWIPELGRWSHIYHLDGRDRSERVCTAKRRILYTQCAARNVPSGGNSGRYQSVGNLPV